jgi:uncharacterized protein YfiM (DUF2279 family)
MKHILMAGWFALAGLGSLQAQSLPRDKQQHFAVGLGLAGTTYITAYDQYYHLGKSKTQSHRLASRWAIGVSVAAGLSKELYDGLIRRDPTWTLNDSVWDLVATSLGGISVVIVIDAGTPTRR